MDDWMRQERGNGHISRLVYSKPGDSEGRLGVLFIGLVLHAPVMVPSRQKFHGSVHSVLALLVSVGRNVQERDVMANRTESCPL